MHAQPVKHMSTLQSCAQQPSDHNFGYKSKYMNNMKNVVPFVAGRSLTSTRSLTSGRSTVYCARPDNRSRKLNRLASIF